MDRPEHGPPVERETAESRGASASAQRIQPPVQHPAVRDGPCLSCHFTQPSCIQSAKDAKISSTRVLPLGKDSRDTNLLQIWGVTGILPGDGLGQAPRTRRELLRNISSLRAASLASRITYFVPTSIANAQRRLLTLWKLSR